MITIFLIGTFLGFLWNKILFVELSGKYIKRK